jgi:hypothetical protein
MTWSFPQFNFTGFNESLTALGYVTSESCGKVTVAPMEKNGIIHKQYIPYRKI